MFTTPKPDGILSVADVKEAADDMIGELLLPRIEGLPLNSGDIWSVVIMVSVNQSFVWEITCQTGDTPCENTVLDWLHTPQRDQLEMATDLLFCHLVMTILDPNRSRIVSINFVDNPYHGSLNEDSGELCKTTPTDGTTTYYRYCTAYVVSNEKSVTLALTYVLDRVGTYLFEINFCSLTNEQAIRRARDLTTTVIPVQKR